jgi:hypothetical protein
MYSPHIDEKHIPILYRRAKEEGIPMTRLVNEIIENTLYEIKHCQSCNAEYEVEKGTKTFYCEKCECEVFVK